MNEQTQGEPETEQVATVTTPFIETVEPVVVDLDQIDTPEAKKAPTHAEKMLNLAIAVHNRMVSKEKGEFFTTKAFKKRKKALKVAKKSRAKNRR